MFLEKIWATAVSLVASIFSLQKHVKATHDCDRWDLTSEHERCVNSPWNLKLSGEDSMGRRVHL